MQTYLDFKMKEDVLVVDIAGDLDHHQASQARDEIDRTIDAFKSKHLVMDFSKVEFMDSSGIGVVMGRYNKVREKEGNIVLTGCSKYVKLILEMAGIFTIVSSCDSLEEAFRQLISTADENKELEVADDGK